MEENKDSAEEKTAPDIKKPKKGKEDAAKTAPAEARHDVDALITAANLKPWEGAGLCRASNWTPGKQVTQAEFDAAVQAFRQRRMGG